MQTAFQQILVELNKINAQIQLKLPANQVLVKRQTLHLALVQQRIKTVQDQIFVNFGGSTNSSSYLVYLTLIQVTQAMTHDANTLRFLAEEYPVDPEGTVACLQEINKKLPDFATRIQHIKSLIKHNSPVFAKKKLLSLHKTSNADFLSMM